jgi:hypothetical protein
MQLLRARRGAPRYASSTRSVARPRSIAPSPQNGLGQNESRYEPQTFGARTVPTDRYTAWLEQREADREREDPQLVRWVIRPRALAGQATRASAVGDQDTQAAAEKVAGQCVRWKELAGA